MAVANQHKPVFARQTSEPHREEERVKLGPTATFQSCKTNTYEMADIERPENKRQMYGSQA